LYFIIFWTIRNPPVFPEIIRLLTLSTEKEIITYVLDSGRTHDKIQLTAHSSQLTAHSSDYTRKRLPGLLSRSANLPYVGSGATIWNIPFDTVHQLTALAGEGETILADAQNETRLIPPTRTAVSGTASPPPVKPRRKTPMICISLFPPSGKRTRSSLILAAAARPYFCGADGGQGQERSLGASYICAHSLKAETTSGVPADELLRSRARTVGPDGAVNQIFE
jgi:hypothetical protein